MSERKQCWCGSRKAFSSCCELYLTGAELAPTAEALMRSRYSAFCTRSVDYLIATHHPSVQDANERASLSRNVNSTRWINLLIVKTQKGQRKDKTGQVEFVAAYQPQPLQPIAVTVQPSDASQLHENSRFVREKGRWFYVDGDMLPLYQPKRSQSCWCGSGKQYKHCHLSRLLA